MTRAQLISRMADDMGVMKSIAEAGLNSMIKNVADAIRDGDKVTLGGLGVFRLERRAARQGRNLKTGEVIDIPSRKVIKFRPHYDLKEAVEQLR